MTRKLTLDDIADTRAYEREREAFRAQIIATKKRRRVGVGPFVTFVFESRATIRFQIQEMARVERLHTDAAIQGELDSYNPLVPERGQLRATLFIELTSTADLETWLPRLVGIERAVALRFGGADLVAVPEDDHAERLTRASTTASVHYIGWDLDASAVASFGTGPVDLAIDHASYAYVTRLGPDTVAELALDVRPETA